MELENPRPPYVENFFSGETFVSTAILKQSDLKGNSGEVSIQLFNTLDDQSNELKVTLDLSKVEDGNCIFKIAALREI